jgi:hypothetical protein
MTVTLYTEISSQRTSYLWTRICMLNWPTSDWQKLSEKNHSLRLYAELPATLRLKSWLIQNTENTPKLLTSGHSALCCIFASAASHRSLTSSSHEIFHLHSLNKSRAGGLTTHHLTGTQLVTQPVSTTRCSANLL